MGLIKWNNVDIQLHLHAEHAEYMPGDVLSGVVEVIVKKEVSWHGVRLQIKGEEYARIGSDKSLHVDAFVHYEEVYALTMDCFDGGSPGDAPLLLPLPDDINEKHSSKVPTQRIQPGFYKFSFALKLPTLLPPSFNVRCESDIGEACLVYTAKAYLDNSWNFGVECFKTFYVLSMVPRAFLHNRLCKEDIWKLESHAYVRDHSLWNHLCCHKQDQCIITTATVEPKVLVGYRCSDGSDASSIYCGTHSQAYIEAKAGNSPSMHSSESSVGEIRICVKVVNDTTEILRKTVVSVKNVVRIRVQGHSCVRTVNVGNPFVFRENIYPGEEKSFPAVIRPSSLHSLSTLEIVDGSVIESLRLRASPFPILRRQKRYIIYEQPLVDLSTSFVTSHCIVSVEFPEVPAEGIIRASGVIMLVGGVDEENHSLKLSSASDIGCMRNTPFLAQAPITPPRRKDRKDVVDVISFQSPKNGPAVDVTGIFPAYTAGGWVSPQTQLER